MGKVTQLHDRFTMHCPQCDSEEINLMASAKWVPFEQDFDLVSVQDACHCMSCGVYSEKAVVKNNGVVLNGRPPSQGRKETH